MGSALTRILLCTSGGLYGARVLDRLLRQDNVEVVGIVLSTRILDPGFGWLRGAVAQLARSGPAYTLYLGCATTLADLMGRWTGVPSVAVSARRRRIPLHPTRDLNNQAGQAFIAGRRSDLLVSAFFNQRIGPAVCALPTAGTVNIHPSLLPAFRGVDPVFFARLRGAERLGVTLHRITESFDTGPVLAQSEVPVDEGASVLAITARLFDRGVELLVDAMAEIRRGDPGQEQAPDGAYDSWPTPAQVGDLRRGGHRLVRASDWSLLRRTTSMS